MVKPTIRIRNVWSVIENIPYEVKEELYEYLSFVVPGSEYSDRFVGNVTDPEEKEKAWDGKIHLFRKGSSSFLTGLTYRACMFFKKEYNLIPDIIWEIKEPKKTLDLKWNYDKYPIREYQEKIISTCINKKRAILECATGSGKTIVIAKIIQELGVAPFIFYVLTKDLMNQAKERLEDAIPGLTVGIIGDGQCDIRDINVITVQTATLCFSMNKLIQKKEIEKIRQEIRKYADMEDEEYKEFKKENMKHLESFEKRESIKNLIFNTNGVYADEVQHFSAKTCKEIMQKSPNAYYRFGGSATPERLDNSYMTIEGLFGRKTAVITASELIRKKFLIRPTIKFIKLKNKKTIVNTWAEDRKFNITENTRRNEIIISLANSLSDEKERTLVLVQMISHGNELKKRIPGAVFVHGSTPREKRKKALEQFKNREIPVLIGSVIADEGLDVPCLSNLIIAGGGKAATRIKQRVGRVIRVDPNFSYEEQSATVYDFLDVGRWSSDHSLMRMETLKKEEEFKVEIISEEDVMLKQQPLF